MSEFIKIGSKNDFKDGELTGVQLNEQAVCVARSGETFYAFEDKCSHAQVLLSRGHMEDSLDGDEKEVVCPLHGARFSAKSGEALTPPAVRPVKTYEVKVEGENIFIAL